jgi:hypothetical protein
MSEYQYYEFTAIDQPLNREQITQLRSYSSRATITPSSFVNEYHWGDFKGSVTDWMRRYFDAFVYTANWGHNRFILRVPHSAFKKPQLMQYMIDETLTCEDTDTHWIIEWSLNEEGGGYFNMEEGSGWMGQLAPLRDELLRGDLRSLYLGGLAGVTAGEIDDEADEPEIPPGLAQLSASQQALMEFLAIDPDLLAVATLGSAEITEWRHDDSMEVWMAGLSNKEMKSIIHLLLQGESQQAERQVKSAFFSWKKENKNETLQTKSRQVSELRTLAQEAENHRLERQAKERERKQAEQRKQRETHLRILASDFERHWDIAHHHAKLSTASGYDEVKRILVDLSEAYALVSSKDVFDHALQNFMLSYAKRPALVRRLVEVGLG